MKHLKVNLSFPAALLIASLSGSLQADAVKLGSFWIENVSVEHIADLKIYYYNNIGVEFAESVDELHGLKLDQNPHLAAYEQAMSDGDCRLAADALLSADRLSHDPWLHQWILRCLIRVYDKLNQPTQAVETFLELLASDAPPAYLDPGPLESLKKADDPTRADLRSRLRAAELSSRSDSAKKAIQSLLAQLSPSSAVLDLENPPPPSPSGTGLDSPDGISASTASGGVIMPRALTADPNDPVTKLLVAGRFAPALAAADRALTSEQAHVDVRLFQRGLAQSLLAAQQGGDRDLYLDAGLSFMRVVTYFPNSDLVGPSLVEAGLVHAQIGRLDIARQLAEKAQSRLDPDTNANYAAKLEQLLTKVKEG